MTDWHVEADDLDRYAAGAASGIGLASIESHLLACASCREALRIPEPARNVDAVWDGIVTRVDRGRWIFTRSSRLAQVSLSSPPLAIVTSLLAAVLGVGVALARVGGAGDATAFLVVLGPLTPLAAARLAFSPRIDPAGAMAGASPLAASRIAAMRALVAVLIACAVGALLTPLTTLSTADVAAWLLPALAASAAAVAIGTFIDSSLPTGLFALLWIAAATAWLRAAPPGSRGASVDGLVTTRTAVQVAMVIVIVVAAVLTVANRGGRRAGWAR